MTNFNIGRRRGPWQKGESNNTRGSQRFNAIQVISDKLGQYYDSLKHSFPPIVGQFILVL